MKNLMILSFVVFSQFSFSQEIECVDEAVKKTTLFNKEKYGAGTSSCGIKKLHLGQFKNTFLVCTSDETEPTEYVVIMTKGHCKPEVISPVTEARTPSFDDDSNLLDSVECSIDSEESEVTCQ